MADKRPESRRQVATSTVLLVIAGVVLGWTLLGLLFADSLQRPFVGHRPTIVHPVAPIPTTSNEPPGWRVAPW